MFHELIYPEEDDISEFSALAPLEYPAIELCLHYVLFDIAV